MKIQKPNLILIIFSALIVLSLSFISAGNLSLFPNPGINEANSYIEYTFNFSNSTNCDASNIILNHTEVVHINVRGFGYVSINISNLSQIPISLCEFRDGDTLRKNHSFSDIIFNTIYARNLNLSGDAIVTGNILASNFNSSDLWTFVGNEAGDGASGSDLVYLGYRAGADNTDDYGTYIGSWAGDASSGAANVFVGYSAGYANFGQRVVGVGYATASDNTGNYVTALGVLAGDTNFGNYSIGIGFEALKSNSGNNVVAIGDQAGEDNTLSDQFIVKQTRINAIPLIQGNFSSGYVGIGTATPQNKLHVVGNVLANNINTTDSYSFVGELAGSGATGSELTLVGYRAGTDNTGDTLTFLGAWAGDAGSGDSNTFIGYSAGYAADGSYVTAVGDTAGSDSVGSHSSFLGYRAGKDNAGNYSIGIGREALFLNSGNNVVAIGHRAGYNSAVPDQFIVKQENVNVVPLIQGNFSSGYVGIGTISPQNMLNVIGDGNFTGNLIIADTYQLNFGHVNSYIKADATNYDPSYYLFKGTAGYAGITSDKAFQFYSNAELDGSGNWQPYILLTEDGRVLVTNTLQGDAEDRYFQVSMTSGMGVQFGGLRVLAGDVAIHTNTLFVNDSTNRVGIGTTTPQNKLNVIGDLNVTEDITLLDNSIYFTEDFGSTGEDGIVFDTSKIVPAIYFTNLTRDDIPLTTNPDFGIFLDTTDAWGFGVGQTVFNVREDIWTGGGISFINEDYDFLLKYDARGDTFSLSDTSTTLFYANVSSQRVGIGTTTPSHELNVVGDLNVTGKIYNSLAHAFGLSTIVGTVASADTWYNITMNRSYADASGFAFSADNITMVVPHDGHYTITFGIGIVDSDASPSAHVGMRVEVNGAELAGSYVEYDTHLQAKDFWLEHTTHAVLSENDTVRLQYISNTTTDTIEQDDTYATQGFNAFGYIQEVMT